MRTLTIILSLVCTTVCGANTKDQAEYNKSMASLMGGMAQLQTAQANTLKAIADYKVKMMEMAQQAEEIKSARMDNELKRTDTFYAKRQKYEAYRKSRTIKRRIPPSQARNVSYQSSTTYVNWPRTFDDSQYQLLRSRLDQLFKDRSFQNSGLGSRNYSQIKITVEHLEALLKNNIKGMKPVEYLAAKNFLKMVDKEAQKMYNVLDKVAAY
jgi:hypothetical protein